MKPEKKIVARRLLHGYATEFYKKDFSKLSGDERSRALLRWYIEEVLNMESFYISADDIDAGYVDAANDYCVDFIHKDDSNIIIIQSKYHKDGSGSSREEVSDFKSSLNRLINKPSEPNKKLEEALSFLDSESDNFYLKFQNFGKTSLQTKEEAEIPLAFDMDAEGLKDRSEFEYLDEQSIAAKIRMHDSDRIDKDKEVPHSYGDGKRTIENITRYNNTQNVVKASDFRSNDEIHTDLGRQFGELSRRGKKVQYIPKRTYFLNPKTHHPIKLEEFAKTIYSFIENPVDFSSSTSILFDDSEKEGYLKVFGDGKNVYTRLDKDTFKYLAGIWWLAEDFATQLESDREKLTDITERAALVRKWFVFFSAMVIVQDKL